MKNWSALVRIQFKPSVFDPQGHAVENAAHSLGYRGATDFRVGKYMTFTVSAPTAVEAEKIAHEVCDKVLCNPVMETYDFTLVPSPERTAPDRDDRAGELGRTGNNDERPTDSKEDHV